MTVAESDSAGSGKALDQPRRVLAAVLRMDLKDSEAAVVEDEAAFLRHMNLLRLEVDDTSKYPSIFGADGGEGDSIRLAFTDVRDALLCAILLRHRAQQPISAARGTTFTLIPRIVLHFGEFTEGRNGRIEGRGQVLVTRLDHAVPPGEILATEDFYDIVRHLGADRGYSFDYVGECDLAKNSGKHPCFAVSIADQKSRPHASRRTLELHELALELFARGDQAAQEEAVEVLGAIETEFASRELANIALGQAVARRVRLAALVKLQERGQDVDVELITREFEKNSPDVETRALLLLILGATGREEVFETLRKVVSGSSQSQRLREAALLAMRRLRGSLITDAVEMALKDSEDEVRIAACVASVTGGVSGAVQGRLREIAQDDSLSMDLRGTACEALAAQKLTNALRDMLIPFVLERNFSLTLRRYAIDGLVRFDDPVAIRTMEEVARRADDTLRADAIIALAAMKAPRRGAPRRAQPPGSHIAEVVQLRTKPQSGGAQAAPLANG